MCWLARPTAADKRLRKSKNHPFSSQIDREPNIHQFGSINTATMSLKDSQNNPFLFGLTNIASGSAEGTTPDSESPTNRESS